MAPESLSNPFFILAATGRARFKAAADLRIIAAALNETRGVAGTFGGAAGGTGIILVSPSASAGAFDLASGFEGVVGAGGGGWVGGVGRVSGLGPSGLAFATVGVSAFATTTGVGIGVGTGAEGGGGGGAGLGAGFEKNGVAERSGGSGGRGNFGLGFSAGCATTGGADGSGGVDGSGVGVDGVGVGARAWAGTVSMVGGGGGGSRLGLGDFGFGEAEGLGGRGRGGGGLGDLDVGSADRDDGVVHFHGAEGHGEPGVVLVGEAAVAGADFGVGLALGELAVDMGEVQQDVGVVGVHVAEAVEGGGGFFPVVALLVAQRDGHEVEGGGDMHVGGGLADHSRLAFGELGGVGVAQAAHDFAQELRDAQVLHFGGGEVAAEVAVEGLGFADGLLHAARGVALAQADVVGGEQQDEQGGGGEDEQDAVEVQVGVVQPGLDAFNRGVGGVAQVLDFGLQPVDFFGHLGALLGGVGGFGRVLRAGGGGEKQCGQNEKDALHRPHCIIFPA